MGTALPLHGAVSELNDRSLQKMIIKSPLPVLVDFWASWCGPCWAFAPVFQEAASGLADRTVFVKVNTEENPEGSGRLGIRSIPTLIMFQSGQEIARINGALPLESFLQWIQSQLRLNPSQK